MKSQNFIALVILILCTTSCRKDEPEKIDFRESYVGEYEILVNSHHWQMGASDSWSEYTITGEIFIYDSSKNFSYVQNTFMPFEPSEGASHGLTIRFTDYYHSHFYLQEDDTIRWAGGYHYGHSGYFTGDSIYFNVTGLGGLGGGSNYYTKGRKL